MEDGSLDGRLDWNGGLCCEGRLDIHIFENIGMDIGVEKLCEKSMKIIIFLQLLSFCSQTLGLDDGGLLMEIPAVADDV